MSYSPEDSMWDEAYDRIAKEIYPDHKEQAVAEFTSERLRSFYLSHPDIVKNSVVALKEARALYGSGHFSAAVVFAASSIELCFKAALLRPVVYGLVHTESLAEAIVDLVVSQNGFLDRYKKLLAGLFLHLADIELNTLKREDASKPLLEEAAELQKVRNGIIHQGLSCTPAEAGKALGISEAVYVRVFAEMIQSLGLTIKKGKIEVMSS